MDKKIKEKLLNEMTEIRNIMFAAQSSFKIVDYLYRTREGLEFEVIRRSTFLLYVAETHWRTYVTEMVKLFKNNNRTEHFNIHQFIDKFKEGNEYRTPLIPNSSIKIWEDNLSLQKESALIENLKAQRDSLYSHTDRNREHIINSLTFIDARELLNIVKRVLGEIYIAVFEEAMIMEPIKEPIDDLKRLMKILVEEKKAWGKTERMLEDGEFDAKSKSFSTDKDGMAKWYED